MNYKWYSLSLCEIEKILRTNAALGLSRKAARSRMRRTGGNSFFFVETRGVWSCFRSVLRDPLFLLLFGVDIVAAIFGELTVALSIGCLLLFNIVVTYLLYIKAQRVTESIAGHSQPRVRVIRDGTLYLADSGCIVPGDILLLSEGDMIPCDCRVLNSTGFAVEIYTGKNGKKVIQQPDANAMYSEESNLEFFEYRNTVYAGSTVISGEARVMVTEIGEQTYIGAFEGGFPLNNAKAKPEIIGDFKKVSSVYSFFALALILLLSVIGIFTYGSDRLLSSFLLGLSLGISLLGEITSIIGSIIYARSVCRNAVPSETQNSGMLKSPEKINILAKTDCVIFSGTTALSDGKSRVVSVYVNGNELIGNEVLSEEANRPAEYFSLLLCAVAEYPTNGSFTADTLYKDFIDYAKKLKLAVNDGVSIKPRSLIFENDGTVYGNIGGIESRNIIAVSASLSLFRKCRKELINGESVIISEERRVIIEKTYRKMFAAGATPYIVTTGSFPGEIFEGIFAMKAVVSKPAKEHINALKKAGIRPIIFVDGERYADTVIIKESGIAKNDAEIIKASVVSDICSEYNNGNAFVGFSADELKRLIQYIKSKGETVTLYGYSYSDSHLTPDADISVSCDRRGLEDSSDFEKLEISEPSGVGNSPDGAEAIRLRSDLLVKRASARGGGVVGIYNSIMSARAFHKNVESVFGYLMLSQIVKIFVTVPSFFFGQTLLTAFQILFGTLFVDILAVLAITSDRYNVGYSKNSSYGLKNVLTFVKRRALLLGIVAIATSLTANILAIVTKSTVSGSVFVAVTLSQMLIMYSVISKKSRKNVEFAAVVISAALIILIFAIIPRLSSITGTVFSVKSLLCIPILPVAVFIGEVIFAKLQKRRIHK